MAVEVFFFRCFLSVIGLEGLRHFAGIGASIPPDSAAILFFSVGAMSIVVSGKDFDLKGTGTRGVGGRASKSVSEW